MSWIGVSSPSPHSPNGGGGGQLLAAPGVIGLRMKSTSLRSVSLPSAQREIPPVPSSVPAPEPSVYGAPAFPS